MRNDSDHCHTDDKAGSAVMEDGRAERELLGARVDTGVRNGLSAW